LCFAMLIFNLVVTAMHRTCCIYIIALILLLRSSRTIIQKRLQTPQSDSSDWLVLASASVVAQRSLVEDLSIHVMTGTSKLPADVGEIKHRTEKNTKKSPLQAHGGLGCPQPPEAKGPLQAMGGSRGSPPGIEVKIRHHNGLVLESLKGHDR
jgi:hypothetical protein